jgi:hypothetical protein
MAVQSQATMGNGPEPHPPVAATLYLEVTCAGLKDHPTRAARTLLAGPLRHRVPRMVALRLERISAKGTAAPDRFTNKANRPSGPRRRGCH